MATQPTPTREEASSRAGLKQRDEEQALTVHGTAIRLAGKGVLLLGPSISGKSDLALRFMDAGASLIADDQVLLRRVGDRLVASAPERLAGLIALRGIGILRVPHVDGALDLAVDLQPADGVNDPLPEPMTMAWLGLSLPRICLDANAPSAVARIRMVLSAERVR